MCVPNENGKPNLLFIGGCVVGTDGVFEPIVSGFLVDELLLLLLLLLLVLLLLLLLFVFVLSFLFSFLSKSQVHEFNVSLLLNCVTIFFVCIQFFYIYKNCCINKSFDCLKYADIFILVFCLKSYVTREEKSERKKT